MKKIVGMLFMLVMLVSMVPVTTVEASSATALTPETFDYNWYLEKHPDLAAIYSADDHDAIWNFYLTTGQPAGWIGRRSKDSYLTRKNFDYDTFLAQNPDILAYFGTDQYAIYDWYMTIGKDGGRVAQTTNEETNVIMQMYDLVESITNSAMSDREKVKAIHDWLCIHVAYDIENYYSGTVPKESFSVVGTIKKGKAVCQGYAETFETFMDILGIENMFIVGDANGGGHAWNKVKVDGNWYWIDVTWDDPVPEIPGVVQDYSYFMISESQMNVDHVVIYER